MRSIWAKIPTAQPAVTQTVHTATSYDGAEIQIIRFTTSAHLQKRKSSRRSEDLSPAWLYFHGGAMIAGEVIPAQVSKLVADSGVQAFGVVYRMPPEDPAPTPVEDCYAALKWVHSHALDLGIDPARLGLMGDSAGGGLATGTALMARDRGLDPPVARQLLIYPMLDDRTIMNMSPDGPLAGFASLPLEDIVLGWEAYLGKENAGKARAEVTAYAAPGRAKDLRGMPATYMDVGNLDLFRDECSLFAARLAAADVDVEFHMFSGVPHGFESAWSIAITARALAGRMSFMTSL
ncbi:alpha/beta hydrolase fold-domain-containing protein [Pseudomassariella vexata]|uniref:Alpha/beta hydrolase fold-domain-containing protein n=1 Tax=Pseudomassariella vexata TaxID=1141098 RepID=A0A1Y2DHX3_9PEZI|nr:alpha/beta hydrolase fold-domain-containing protein [Pseudomassariella vexata]ORY58827.1 alpha/beta hydrolase fold-domain-containing protein [Pseudomassariella vexata]